MRGEQITEQEPMQDLRYVATQDSTFERDEPKMESETRNQALEKWEINIRFLSVGCVISVGCKTIGFNDVDEAMRELTSYVSNPMEEREKWSKIFNS